MPRKPKFLKIDFKTLKRLIFQQKKLENPPFVLQDKAPKGSNAQLIISKIEAAYKAHGTDETLARAMLCCTPGLLLSEKMFAQQQYPKYVAHVAAIAEAKAKREEEAKKAAEEAKQQAEADAAEKVLTPTEA